MDRLVRLAHRRLGTAPRALADEEDVVLSAFDSFLRAVNKERFSQLEDRSDLWQVLYEDAPSLRRLDNAIPRDLETVCLKCLQKKPEQRYQTSTELAEDLNRWLTGHPIQARPVSYVERSWRWCRRNSTITALSAAVAIVLLAGTAVSGFFWFQSEAARRTLAQTNVDLLTETDRANQKAIEARANSIRAECEASCARAESKRADAEAASAKSSAHEAHLNLKAVERTAYASDMLAAQRDWEEANIGQLRQRLDRYRNRDDLKGFEWGYWDRLVEGDLLTLNGHASEVNSVTFNPDGTWLAFGGGYGDNSVKVWNAATGQLLRTLNGHTNAVQRVVFSPDGKRLASASHDKTVKVWDVATGQETLTLNGHTSFVNSVAFSPDGTRLAYTGSVGGQKMWNAATGQLLLTLEGYIGYVSSVIFSPDGTRLAGGGVL